MPAHPRRVDVLLFSDHAGSGSSEYPRPFTQAVLNREVFKS